MKFERLFQVDLKLFDGEGGSAAAPAGGAEGGAQAAPGGTEGVKEQTPSAQGEQGPAKQPTEAERRKAFLDLVNSDQYKDLYAKEIHKIIDKRLKDDRTVAERHQPLIDLLAQRYNIEDGDIAKLTAAIESDTAYWTHAAEEAGLSVDQYQRMQRLQRENAALLREQQSRLGRERAQRQYAQWEQEAEEARALYPSLDLGREVQSADFLSLLRSGVPVKVAYEAVHMEEIKAGIAALQAKATEKQVVDNIRAKGDRPPENGASAQSAFTTKTDVSKLTKAQRADIVRRIMRGEPVPELP